MTETDQNIGCHVPPLDEPEGQDVFERMGQWGDAEVDQEQPLVEVLEVGHWGDGGISGPGDPDFKEPESQQDDDPDSFGNLLSTLEFEKPINVFKRIGGSEDVEDPDKYYEEVQKDWEKSEEFLERNIHRLPYEYYDRTVRMRFPKFSHGHKASHFKRIIERGFLNGRVEALGMLRLPNEWQMTLLYKEDRERLLRKKIFMLDSRKMWIYPISSHEIRGTVHRLPLKVSNQAVRNELCVLGRVYFVEIIDPEAKAELKKYSKGVRYFSLYLDHGKTTDDIPKLITVSGCEGFISIPGRTPICFHCRRDGHSKKYCPIRHKINDFINHPIFTDTEYTPPGDIAYLDAEAFDMNNAESADPDIVEALDPDEAESDLNASETVDMGNDGINSDVVEADDTDVAEGIDPYDAEAFDPYVAEAFDPYVAEALDLDEELIDYEVREIVESMVGLLDRDTFRNILAELHNLENELIQTLEETEENLKEKCERCFRIFHNLLTLE